jgi:sarcosine oxidase subunit gamma
LRERALTVDVARSALAGRDHDLAGVGARDVGFLAQVDVRVDAAATRLALPGTPNTWLAEGDREVLWLGPDEWLVVGRHGTEREIADQIDRALAGTHHSVVDVSAARAVIDLDAPDRLEVLSNGCGLDLHPRSWRDGKCAQTLLARIPVILQERTTSTRLFVRASFSNHLVDWLVHVVDVRG